MRARLIGAGLIGATMALLLVGCGPPAEPAGAPPMDTDAPIGAVEQMPGATTPASTDAPTAATTEAAPSSISQPFTCPEQTVTALTGKDLRKALLEARPGDVIYIESGIYPGHFTIKAKGTAARPIYLCGPSDAVLDGRALNTGYVLHLDGAQNWRLSGFMVRNGQKGIMADNSKDNALQNLHVEETGDEAVHLRKGSTGNVVQGLEIRKTGKVHPKFGEGLYVGTAKSNWCEISACGPDRSDRNQLLGNKIDLTTAEAIDVKEGTTGGVIAGNTFDGRGLTGDADSWVDVKGNQWTISNNRGKNTPKDGYQTHVILPGWGDRNVFTDNTAVLTGSKGGVAYYLHKPLKNRIACDNTQTGASRGLSNVHCK